MKKEEVKQTILNYRATFATPQGEQVLADLVKYCHGDTLTYVDGNPNGSAFEEGKRFVLLHIQRLMAIDPNDPNLLELTKGLI